MRRIGSEAARWRRRVAVGVVAVALLGAAACSGDDDDEKGDQGGSEESVEQAPEGLVQVVMPADIDVDLESIAGAVGTETMHVALAGTAEVDEIGNGRAARRPADGERFVVAKLVTTPVPVTGVVDRITQGEMAVRGKATFGVTVGDAAAVALSLDTPSYTPLPIDLDDPPQPPVNDPAVPQERLVVASLPENADQLDLVMSSPGLEQRLSLLTGEPGPDNVAVLARASRDMAAPIAGQDVSFTRTEFGMSDSTTEKVGIHSASLQWAAGLGDDRKAGAGRAFLHVAFDGAVPNLSRATELRLADGTIVQPAMPADQDDMLTSISPEVVFDVPAGFTEGTIILGKDFTWDVPTGGTMSARFDNKAEYPLAIPAAA